MHKPTAVALSLFLALASCGGPQPTTPQPAPAAEVADDTDDGARVLASGTFKMTAAQAVQSLGLRDLTSVQLAATPQSATSARLLVQVTGAAASAGTWSVQPSQECGGPDGPVQASGPLAWQDGQHASAQVPASRADLITVTVQTSAGILSAADCVQVP